MKAHGGISSLDGRRLDFAVRGTRWIDCPEPGIETIIKNAFATCDYCGSFNIDDTIRFFQTKGVNWSGSDWKYGWPHKFYLHSIPCQPYRTIISSRSQGSKREFTWGVRSTRDGKFYSEHLLDATPEQLEQWNRIVAPLTGIQFRIEDGELKYTAPRHGHQADGIVA